MTNNFDAERSKTKVSKEAGYYMEE